MASDFCGFWLPVSVLVFLVGGIWAVWIKSKL